MATVYHFVSSIQGLTLSARSYCYSLCTRVLPLSIEDNDDIVAVTYTATAGTLMASPTRRRSGEYNFRPCVSSLATVTREICSIKKRESPVRDSIFLPNNTLTRKSPPTQNNTVKPALEYTSQPAKLIYFTYPSADAEALLRAIEGILNKQAVS
ncbi:hypothetical protein BO83DRAFT_392356 [Aspergillus eucalypticola CBS 122712]|uniref:Uncharacterized protein n=1 Tax=Aspergillus eucalypticola (strain CBS 122712 / IBT 29274) TaxID=1448314 RepID=A0A317UUR3_ASPEC|nr:uncharacterized protein BO83DRAFT_392356 [Aspergillus eucalypticola CBS 122712]PWY64818.1 hypothetical protein BO83DRAFT_392356 [Aspergillus eucalypticola CBS 122712]